jgi:small subunit ribosomal protein S7
MENVRPVLEVKQRRVGGATYQVPVEVRSDRSVTLALRWLLLYAREKKGKPMDERLAEELIAASCSVGWFAKSIDVPNKDDYSRINLIGLF